MYCSLKQQLMTQAMNTIIANEKVSLSNGQTFQGQVQGRISSDLLDNVTPTPQQANKTILLNQGLGSQLSLLG
ncbi:MAG: hypothetical protein ACKO34_04515 [Vampirovibrionales bacterium]